MSTAGKYSMPSSKPLLMQNDCKTHQDPHTAIIGIKLVIDFIRTWPCGKAEYCSLSYEPENEVARALYRSLGFIENGEMDGDEIVAVLKL